MHSVARTWRHYDRLVSSNLWDQESQIKRIGRSFECIWFLFYFSSAIAVPSSMSAINMGHVLKKSGSQPTQDAGNMSDDEPLYDAVASDDDYATLTPIPKPQTQQQPVRISRYISSFF